MGHSTVSSIFWAGYPAKSEPLTNVVTILTINLILLDTGHWLKKVSVYKLKKIKFWWSLSQFFPYAFSDSSSSLAFCISFPPVLCYWCLYCLGLLVGSISVGFHGGFLGCFPKNPVVKLGTLTLKTICKPIVNRLKKEAGLHPNFRHFIIDFAQVLSLLSPFFFFFIYGFLLLIWVLFFHLYSRNSSVVTNLYMGYLSNTIETCYNYELQPKFCANWYVCIWDEVS